MVMRKVNICLLESRHPREDTASGRALYLLGPNLQDIGRRTGEARMRDVCCLRQEDGGKAGDTQHFRVWESHQREVSTNPHSLVLSPLIKKSALNFKSVLNLGRTRKNSLLPSSGDGRKNSLLPGADSGGRRSSLLPPGYSQRRKSSARRNSTFDAFLQKKGGRKFSINDDDDEENKLGKNRGFYFQSLKHF